MVNNRIKYGDGICFEKKEKVKKTGTKNQNIFFSFKIPNERQYKAITEKITA